MTRTISERIERWMSAVVERSDFDHFLELHVDEVAPEYDDRKNWAAATLAILEEAQTISRRDAWSITVTIGVSLSSGRLPLGFEGLLTLDEIVEQADWSPPSLYLFEPGQEPWRGEDGCATASMVLDQRRGVVAYCCEWYHAADDEFRRTCWIATTN